VVAPIRAVPELLGSWVVHASLIQSDREILRFSHDLSMLSARESSIVTEYRTIQICLVVHMMRVSIDYLHQQDSFHKILQQGAGKISAQKNNER
jgi:hypothetical protein